MTFKNAKSDIQQGVFWAELRKKSLTLEKDDKFLQGYKVLF